MKNFNIHFLLLLIILFFSEAKAAVTSVVLTPATPDTMSNGHGYYLAGNQYSFQINVIDPAATSWTDITDVRLQIPDGVNIFIIADISAGGVPSAVVSSGNVTITMDATDISGTWNNFTLRYRVTFRWDTAGSPWAASRNIVASVNGSPITDTKTVSYGVVSSFRVLNFAQDGVATDGYVNPYRTNFNVTGTLIYDIPGGGISDAIPSDAAHITGSELYINNTATGLTAGSTNAVSYTVTSAISIPTPPTVTAWRVRITGPNVPAGGRISTNSLAIINDEVEILDVEIVGGGGRVISGAPSRVEYRSFNVAGTQIRVTARMRYGLTGVIGNTTVRVRDVLDGIDYDIVIPNGNTTGVLAITGGHPTTPGIGGTNSHEYRVTNIFGGATDSEQNAVARIFQPGNGFGNFTTLWWDNQDPPGVNGSAFTSGPSHSTTATTLTINWGALASSHPDLDFDTYKIYYREQGSSIWTIIDRTTSSYASLGTMSTNTVLIEGLKPLTTYEYVVSAVDIFGNEVAPADRLYPGTLPATTPASVTINLTDGIASYSDSAFNGDPDPVTNLRLRKSAIRADFVVITAGAVPSSVELLLANNSSDVAVDHGSGTTDLITDLPPGDIYTIPCQYMGPNKWTAFIPSEHPLMTTGNSVRFILKATYNTGVSYFDHDSEGELPPGNPADSEWRFYIYEEPKFTPWPVRVLNNVITDKDPVAYPAYYLTDDAYVTITVYDIKGRVVSVLLDSSFRKAGQNIKEQGWRGTNKYNKKLGIGLYYIHFKAKRVSDGKVILDSFQKVVVAK